MEGPAVEASLEVGRGALHPLDGRREGRGFRAGLTHSVELGEQQRPHLGLQGGKQRADEAITQGGGEHGGLVTVVGALTPPALGYRLPGFASTLVRAAGSF